MTVLHIYRKWINRKMKESDEYVIYEYFNFISIKKYLNHKI